MLQPTTILTTSSVQRAVGPRDSIPSGDIALCNLPPYGTQPWLSMGVVLHYALLREAGFAVRVIRPLPPPFEVPLAVLHPSLFTFTRDPRMEARVASMEAASMAEPAFFTQLVEALASGGERVVGLSIFRNNVDVTIEVARQLKKLRPDVIIVIGGPEAMEEPESLLLPWVDAVVGRNAEAIVIPLFRALCDGQIAHAATLPSVWTHQGRRRGLTTDHQPVAESAAMPSVPSIPYDELMPLLLGDEEATVPMLLNWGCPYRCGFCSNRNVYSRFTEGSVTRVVDEMEAIVQRWSALHHGHAPGLSLQMSDATTNALPEQFDALLDAITERRKQWAVRPHLRGQTLFDRRITAARVVKMRDAGFASTFFGLDTASDRLRKELQKPGNAAQVAEAMQVYHRAGGKGLHFGVPVGMPGETDADFQATEEFLAWSMELKDAIESITVLPYTYFLSAQDPHFQEINQGERRGVLWRASVPGGDPAVRARRMMRLFDVIDGRVPVNSPIPPFLALPVMLPANEHPTLDAWMERHGRSFDQLRPDPVRRGQAEQPELVELFKPVSVAFERAELPPGWKLVAIDWMGGNAARGLVVLLETENMLKPAFALLVEKGDPDRQAYVRTEHFNISYLKEHRGTQCAFNPELLKWCAALLAS